MYSVSAYLIGWFAANSPLMIVSSSIFSLVFYNIVGLRQDLTSFLTFLLVVIILQFVTVSAAYASVSGMLECGG
jgi:ABC-type multidrug transport system permease subunit